MNDTDQRLQALEAFADSLRRSSTIPREVETAFAQRLGSASGTGTATTASSGSFPVSVPTVVGTLKITVNGIVYNVLYQ